MKKITFLTLLISLNIMGYCQDSTEEKAIKQLLEKESATWRSGDVTAHAACWHIQPYSKILVSTADNKVLDVSPDFMIHPPANAVGQGGTSVNADYTMSIHGNDAWVSHKEESTAKDGTKSYSYEMKILEKINGEWKLVAQSIHLYKNNKPGN